MKSKSYVKMVALATIIAVPMMVVGGAQANVKDQKKRKCNKKPRYEYMTGDFHQHTLYTDGSNTFTKMMEQNNEKLQWWANSEHGGERNRDGNGNHWDDPAVYPVNPILGDYEESRDHQEMWRWQSLRDFVYPDIKKARNMYPDKTIISGLEWNVPGHEHTSTAIYQYDDTANAISEFEFRFDRSDDDNSRVGEAGILGDTLTKTNGQVYPNGDNTDKYSKTDDQARLDAIAAVKWMQAMKDAGIGDAWIIPAHIERASSFLIEDFRNWQDAGPDVAYGFEGSPGHQVSGTRGFGYGSLGGGTRGGAGFYIAKVGGLWDGLSAEGRKWFNFASSDDHGNWRQGRSDFWPGEYQKIYTYINTNAKDKIQAVFDGNRSGNSWSVWGDLIDELEFTARSGKKKAMMGQTLKVKKGAKVRIKIKVHDPKTANHCPLDIDNPSLEQVGISQPMSMPVLDHIDLIGGSITGKVPMTNQDHNASACEGITDPGDQEDCLFDEWQKALVSTDYGTDASVIKTFEREGGADKNGYLTYVMTIEPKNSMFIRLRGTNMPANVPYETDWQGNPLLDSLASAQIYDKLDEGFLASRLFDWVEDVDTTSKLDEVAEAFADLWFYSNPIYIQVGNKGGYNSKK